MKRRPYSEQVSQKYIDQNLENTQIMSFLEYKGKGYAKYLFDDLAKTDIKGFPFSSDFVSSKGKSYSFIDFENLSDKEKADCKLRFFYLPNYHELYIGTTGSGKTTGCIEPQIRAISTQKNKANLFITDPKGELFEHNGKYLKDQGYNVFVLNFRNLGRTHTWNPLKEMYEKQMESLTIGKNSKKCNCPVDKSLALMSEKSKYQGTYIAYKHMAFATQEDFDKYVNIETYLNKSKVSSLVNQLCDCIFSEDKSTTDRTWSDGARGLFHGILLSMLEEAVLPGSKFTEQHMTLKTVNDIFNLIREGSETRDSYGDHYTNEEMNEKMVDFLHGKSSICMSKLNNIIKTAQTTRKGFLSTFLSTTEKWMQGHIYQLTSHTSISLEDNEHPWAVFVSTRDYDKSDNVIAGLFIDWVYRQSLQAVEEKRKLGLEPRPIHFLLDEFANIPRIPDFDNKIATARSRNMWFHLFVQSYDQLDLIYGEETASIIVDNCNQQTFLGSQSQETKERFSRECGKKTVTSLEGVIHGEVNDVVEIPVVPITSLDQIKPGEMYTKRIYSPILKCSFIRSYQCAQQGIFKDFWNNKAEEDLIPLNYVIPDDLEHSYLPVLSAIEVRRLCPPKPRNPRSRVQYEDEDEDMEAEDPEDFEDFLHEVQLKMKGKK